MNKIKKTMCAPIATLIIAGSLIGGVNAAISITAAPLGDGFRHDMNGSLDDYFTSSGQSVNMSYYYYGVSDNRVTRTGYLQFNLAAMSGPASSATLNLYILGNSYTDNSPSAGHIRHVANAASADGNASQRLNGTEAVATSIQGLPNDAWISYDVTSYIQNDQTNGYSYAAFSFNPDESGGGWRNSGLSFASADSANKPFLQITTVPEPSSFALLGLGGMALMLRRKR